MSEVYVIAYVDSNNVIPQVAIAAVYTTLEDAVTYCQRVCDNANAAAGESETGPTAELKIQDSVPILGQCRIGWLTKTWKNGRRVLYTLDKVKTDRLRK